MKKPFALLALAAAFAGLGASLPAQADPPSWAPAHGYRAKQPVHEYRYVYYPAQQIYFAPATQTWFWLNGGTWQFGINLPAQYRGYVTTDGVPVVLDTGRPYTRHAYVEEHYGRPWREQHRHPAPRHDRDGHRDAPRDRDHGHDDHDRHERR
jgi:hypothetical protein